jgi:hypothetical protein
VSDEPDKPLPARGEATPPPEVVPAPQFEFRVSLSPEEIVESFRNDARIEWVAKGPPGSFALAGKHFQAWRASETRLVVRHAVWDPSHGPSPNVHIEWMPHPKSGTLVRGVFARRAVPVNNRPLLVISALAGVLFLVVLLVSLEPRAVLYLVGSIAAFFALRSAMSDRPTPKSMQNFGPGLWRLVGEKFVPHALGPAEDDPFRE